MIHRSPLPDVEIPDHPLIREVMKDVLTEAMDLEGLIALLAGIRTGAIRCLAVDSAVPSAFAHELLNANPYAFLDDAPLEERRTQAVFTRRSLDARSLSVNSLPDFKGISRAWKYPSVTTRINASGG